jgi:hypothetical protein
LLEQLSILYARLIKLFQSVLQKVAVGSHGLYLLMISQRLKLAKDDKL